MVVASSLHLECYSSVVLCNSQHNALASTWYGDREREGEEREWQRDREIGREGRRGGKEGGKGGGREGGGRGGADDRSHTC